MILMINIAYHYDCDKVEAKKLKERYGFAKCFQSQTMNNLLVLNNLVKQKFLSNHELSEAICPKFNKIF
jgi:hypothetical protein